MKGIVVFTDLDGTLLDHDHYSVRRALPALDLMVRRSIPVVPVSSKTSGEIRMWMKKLFLSGPFVYENGGGVSIPDGYFDDSLIPAGSRKQGGEWRIAIGIGIEEVRSALREIAAETGLGLRGFGDMDSSEIAGLTGLKGEELNLCLNREYDEPFIVDGENDLKLLEKAVKKRKLTFSRGGRFFHLTGGCDKSRGVRVLTEQFRAVDSGVITAGLGDSQNDLPIFDAVDEPYLVMRPDGTHDPDVPATAATRVMGVGPHGWRMAIEELLADHGTSIADRLED